MISASRLLADCQKLVRSLEDDLRERLSEHPDLDAPLRDEHARAKEGKRTSQTYNAWRDEYLTQVAVHWVLATVFVRFLEDNRLLPEPWLSGPSARREQAQERQAEFFLRQPAASDREYLLACFREVEALPAMEPLFDERHNPVFRLGPSADGAREIVSLWRRVDPASEQIVHDFTDEAWGTRFLGDLYQDLSEDARKKYALLQTPEFVEEFLLDRTLEPAMAEFGYQNVRLIDPTCGSGHFLLGAFHRLFQQWDKDEPGTNERELVRRALDQVYGVDLNPFAVAIARFRLLVAALKVSGIERMRDAPAFPLNLAAGDSLLHGLRPKSTRGIKRNLFEEDPLAHFYETEDADELRRVLGQQYHVVVGNPPYITPKDPALNEAYRQRFGSCHRQYSLAVPFIERFFDLAVSADPLKPAAGWVGMITANSFMKREFGKKLIEEYMTHWDLTYVIDTSGAYIPGHGTPTVLLIGRSRPPIGEMVRAVMGIRGEPSTPEDPSKGLVWSAILAQVDKPSSQSPFLSVSDLPRVRFSSHPWSIGGGGAAELKEFTENSRTPLRDFIDVIGRTTHTGADECFYLDASTASRRGLTPFCVPLVIGEDIRNWQLSRGQMSIFPYDRETADPLTSLPTHLDRHFWPLRFALRSRQDYGQTPEERGLSWFAHSMFFPDRYRVPLGIAFAFVATHNHFAIDRGGKVFKQTAPIIKLPANADEDAHLGLLGILNSSTACFWMKQVLFDRGNGGIGGGISSEDWERRHEHDGTKIQQFPVCHDRPMRLTREIDTLTETLATHMTRALLKTNIPSRSVLNQVSEQARQIERRMVACQDEIDWQVYRFYGLIGEALETNPIGLPEVALGERAFEIALARKMAAGEIQTKWFERHGSTPITEIPSHWPESYRKLVEKRLQAIEENPWIALIEQPEYKRRWNREPWEEQEKRALRDWLLDRLEDPRYWPEPRPISVAALADLTRKDDDFRQVASLYRSRDDFNWTDLLTELVLDEAVPFLAAWRYADSGLRKRADWEETWRLQRLEDAIDARTKLPEADPRRLTEADAKALKAKEVGTIAVPPKYASADFRKPAYWRLRGKLDVPKERFVLYPGLERGSDPSPVIGWAGWDHLQQAQALATLYQDRRENEGWDAERLKPALAGLLELLPWLLQWHNEPDPAHGGLRLGEYFEGFLDEEARVLSTSRADLASWKPAETAKRGRRPKASAAGKE